jgi:hypothetical protein
MRAMSRPERIVPWAGTTGVTRTAWPDRGCDGCGGCAVPPWSACGSGTRACGSDDGCWAGTCASRRRSGCGRVHTARLAGGAPDASVQR